MKHTPEPWEVAEAWTDLNEAPTIHSMVGGISDPIAVFHCDPEHFGEDGEEGALNATRAVACVNALAGVEDPQNANQTIDFVREYVEVHELYGEPDWTTRKKFLNTAKAILKELESDENDKSK